MEIAGAAKSFHAYYRVVPIEDGDYVIDHSVAVYLVDARGRSVAFIAPDERHDAALKKLRSLVEGSLVNLSPFRLFDLSARAAPVAPSCSIKAWPGAGLEFQRRAFG